VAKPTHSGRNEPSGADRNLSDLVFLSNKTKPSVVATLQQRYMSEEIYTRVGARVLLSVNPCKQLNIYDKETGEKYVKDYRNCSGQREELPPHIYSFANTVYFHLKRSGIDQSVVIK
jgi:chitin synthase